MGGTAASRITNSGTDNSGINGASLGASGGDQRLHGHSHTFTPNTSTVFSQAVATNWDLRYGDGNVIGFQRTASNGGTNSPTGTGTGQNMPPAIILNYIIKT
jgi:hypothetical protein